MKKHRNPFIRTIALALCLVVTLCNTADPTLAATPEPNVQPRYKNILSFSSQLDIADNGKATGTMTINLASSASSAEITLELQQQNGNSWTTIKTWGPITGHPYFITQTEIWYVSSGYNYKFVASVDIFDSDGNLIDSGTTPSSIIYH